MGLTTSLDSFSEILAKIRDAATDDAFDSQAYANDFKQGSKEIVNLFHQDQSVLLKLRFVEIGLPIGLSLLSLWMLLGYPLSESKMEDVTAELERRRKS